MYTYIHTYYTFILLIFLCGIPQSFGKALDKNLTTQDTATIPWYSMRINFPAAFKKIPALCGYYKGYKLDFDENLCIIPENNPACSYFTVIATEQVKYTRDTHDGTLEHLERLTDKPCRLFHISRRNKQWLVQEEQADNIPSRLPAEALVLLINPILVDGFITQESTHAQTPVITLPTLYIKPTITQQEFDIYALQALSASLDVNPMHSRVKKAVKKERSYVISLREPA